MRCSVRYVLSKAHLFLVTFSSETAQTRRPWVTPDWKALLKYWFIPISDEPDFLPSYPSEPLFRSRLSMVMLIKTHILVRIRHNMLAIIIILPATILAVPQQAIPVISSSDDAYTSCESCPIRHYVSPQATEHRLS